MSHPIERIRLRSLRTLADSLQRLVEGRLWAKVLLGLFLGAAAGVVLGPGVGWVQPQMAGTLVSWLALPGTLFLALIQMILIPLVFASLVRGLAVGENLQQLKRMGIAGAAFFVATTALAVAPRSGCGQPCRVVCGCRTFAPRIRTGRSMGALRNHPLMTPIGRNRATLRANPASCTRSTTRSTSL